MGSLEGMEIATPWHKSLEMTSCLKFQFRNFASEYVRYFEACARIRELSRPALIRKLLEMIAEEQLVLAILDDDSRVYRRKETKCRRNRPRVALDRPRPSKAK